MAWNSTCQHWLAAEAALEKYYLPVFYGIEFALGILGNATVVLGSLFCLKKWNSSHVYLFNLSVSDLAFLCTLPLLMRSYARDAWVHGPALCVLNRYVLHANLYGSVLFLAFISLDRYLLLRHPFREHPLQRRELAALVSLAVWGWVTLGLLPILPVIHPAAGGEDEDGAGTRCADYASSGDPRYSLIYSLCLTVLGFLLPLAAMGFFYHRTAVLLRRRNRQVASALPLEKPLRLVVLAVVVFSVLLTPYHVLRNARIAARLGAWRGPRCARALVRALYVAARPLAFLNSVVDPVFYFLVGDRFRDLLLGRLRRVLRALTFSRGCARGRG
ncbi:succinate receptor 1 [Perognathus longimembris pacificus]|uniref:succinate receptor 1 n=1 Tax=Perognathus longimembris pacificus TaxID=214514 RepID=UPI002019237A|nr:succinate receptor 1 [Perognathus longimembris pacificus]